MVTSGKWVTFPSFTCIVLVSVSSKVIFKNLNVGSSLVLVGVDVFTMIVRTQTSPIASADTYSSRQSRTTLSRPARDFKHIKHRASLNEPLFMVYAPTTS
jgi:hypothetical protein